MNDSHRPRPLALAGWFAVASLGAGLALPAAAAPPPASPAPPAIGSPVPGVAVPGKAVPGALPTIDLEEVQIGQRGYGLSVFAGGQPERFEVEVIGVMRNISPDMSYILARLSGRGLESSGVAAGMSGSPVFLDGRLAGAVSFGWPFAKEAICGVTPIASMRRLTTLGGPLPVTPPPPVELAALLAGRVPTDLLASQLARLRTRIGGAPEGALTGIEWSAAGFGELSRGMLRQALGSIAPMGQEAAGRPGVAPPELVPGSAVAAVLASGDFQLAATGTVTDRLGDRILAFGHPFLGLGAVRLPMAAAEVLTVLSSQNTSFKIANLGPAVGAFEQDRQAGIEGRLGAVAPMIPMVLRVRSLAAPAAGGAGGPAAEAPAPRQFRVQLADLPELLPLLAGSTLLGGLESASYSDGPQTIDMVARFQLERYGELAIHQSFDGDKAGTAMAGHLVALVGYLMQSPLERVRISGLEVDVEQSPQPRAASLVAAHADRSLVHPGDRLGINVELQAYRGDRFRHSFAVRLPSDLPVGRYTLLVGDGPSADAARLALAPTEPATFSQALALLRSLHSRRDLALLGFYGGSGGAGLSVGGEAMPRLPASVRSLWTAEEVSGAAAPQLLHAAIVQERHETLAVPIEGMVRIDLQVRRREAPEEPVPPDGGAPDDSHAVQEVAGGTPAAGGRGLR